MAIRTLFRSLSGKSSKKTEKMSEQQQQQQQQQAQAGQAQQAQAAQQQKKPQPVAPGITREQEIEAYGWQAVPRSNAAILNMAQKFEEAPVFRFPELEQNLTQTDLTQKVEKYAKEQLPMETFNHSMRVFLYGLAIAKTAFPSWLTPSFVETYYFASLLHDIGTTDTNMSSTLLSFEFHGGVTALTLFQSLGAPKAQAESVAETIIRHQDLGETGTVTRITALILLATLLDNAGENPHLVSKGTIEEVVARWPRMKWTGCFASTVRKEIGQKPWAHSTHIEGFAEKIEGNKLMEPYE